MKTASLEAYGAHPELLSVWAQEYDGELLPIQERAVIDGRVLQGHSIVGSGPTGCGKTFIGELAAAHAASLGKPTFYLVPTRALAEAKFEQFARSYGPLGMRVCISTSDRRADDRRVARGEFDLTVTVPEKLWSLTLDAHGLFASTGALVVDELQGLSDPERGPRLELLLARFAAQRGVQIVGLSAVLSNGQALADWLGATLIEERKRPVELRKGVWCDDVFRFAEHNGGCLGQEELCVSDRPGVLGLAAALAGSGEPTLLFLRDRRSCTEAATLLAEAVQGPPAQEALEHIQRLPRTRSARQLVEVLGSGVAFHNADLHHAERRAVERGFARGEIRCLVATTTLAVGVNLPARNVIVDPMKWQAAPGERPIIVPLSQAEFENMAGRAGRLGFGDEFGRAILVAEGDVSADAMMTHYVAARPEPVESQLPRLPEAQRLLLSCVAAGDEGTPLRTFDVEHTAAPDEVVERALADGLVWRSPVSGNLSLTGPGRAAAGSGLHMETVAAIQEHLLTHQRAPTNAEALLLASLSAEARSVPLGAARKEAQWELELRRRLSGDASWTEGAEAILRSGPLRQSERELGARVALIVTAWSGHGASADLEEETTVASGRALAICSQVGWVVQCISQFVREAGMEPADVDRLTSFGESLSAALPPECLPLMRLRLASLQRDHVLALWAAGFTEPGKVCEASDAELGRAIPQAVIAELRERGEEGRSSRTGEQAAAAAPAEATGATSMAPILLLDDERPDLALVNGTEVALRPMEFQLLSLLAVKPRRCVSFDRLYDALWGSREAVEPQQIYWHRHNLSKKLEEAFPGREDPVVRTIPRRGLMLDLPREGVVVS